jgi:hypothetical protein
MKGGPLAAALRGDASFDSRQLDDSWSESLMAVKLRAISSRPPTLRVAYSAPKRNASTAEEIRRFTLPATKALPFVKPRPNDQPMWFPESFWHVEPTGKREMDVRLGRRYARQAIAAMKADRNSHVIAHIIQDIIKEVSQRAWQKKGRGRRDAVVLGFLSEISEAIAAAELRALVEP